MPAHLHRTHRRGAGHGPSGTYGRLPAVKSRCKVGWGSERRCVVLAHPNLFTLFRGQRAKPSQRHTCQWGWPSAVRRCHPGSAAMWVDCSSHASGDFIEARHPSVQALISHLKSTTGPCATSNGNASGALLQQGDKHLLHGLEYSKQLGSSSFQ
eukprot:s1688_g7.t4